jgi:hypothetical protein
MKLRSGSKDQGISACISNNESLLLPEDSISVEPSLGGCQHRSSIASTEVSLTCMLDLSV